MRLAKLVQARDEAAARRVAREEAYRDGYHGLRVLEITPEAIPWGPGFGWRVRIEAAGKRDDPWREDDDPTAYGYQSRAGARVRTRVPTSGVIRGQRVSMPAGLTGTVRSYVGSYRRVLLDVRPEGTFVFRPPDLAPLDDER